MDGYFYKNIQTKKYDKDEYIKFLEAQVIILREDNKRLIKELERKEK